MDIAKKVGPHSRVWISRSEWAPVGSRHGARLGRRRAGLALLVLALFMVFGAGHAAAAGEGLGPFPVRNFQAFQQLVLGMPGDRATVLKPQEWDLRVELAETASAYREQTPQITAAVKFETLRSGIFFRYGLTERLEVGAELPIFYRSRGFLEGAINQVERLTTGVAPVRAGFKDTSFAFNVTRNGGPLFKGADDHVGLGDMTLSGKYQVMTQEFGLPAVSLRFALKLPTGDEGRTFGSGRTDLGVGIAVDKALSERWILYGNLNGILPTGRVAGLGVGPMLTGLAAAEYRWSPTFSLVAQFEGYSSPYRNTGADFLDNGVTEVTLGFSYLASDRYFWQVYGVENIDFPKGSAADFTLATVLTYRFRQ